MIVPHFWDLIFIASYESGQYLGFLFIFCTGNSLCNMIRVDKTRDVIENRTQQINGITLYEYCSRSFLPEMSSVVVISLLAIYISSQ